MSGAPIVIEAAGLGKRYRVSTRPRPLTLREAISNGAHALWRRAGQSALATEASPGEFWAVRDVSFRVAEGEAVGLIGSNGSGKSTLLKMIARIVTPTAGEARIRGRVGALLEVGTGFHPELTGRDNIFLNGALIGMSAQVIRRRFDEIVEFSGMEDFLDLPIKRYSSGMAMRLAFAVAAHLEPDVLIIDEVLAVGDAEFQRKCLARMDQVAKSGCTVFFVSHNLAAVQRLCSRAILLSKGQVVADGSSGEVVGQYLDYASQRVAPNEWAQLPAPPRQRQRPLITGVRYSDPDRPSSSPRSFGRLRIEAQIDSPERVQAAFSADIRDELGNKLINADSWRKAHHHIDLPVGRSTWRFDIESLYLEAGRYVIDLWLGNVRGSALDYRPTTVQFTVLNGDALPPDMSRPPQEFGSVPCRFKLMRVDSSEGLRSAG